jgi:hypothetical protein
MPLAAAGEEAAAPVVHMPLLEEVVVEAAVAVLFLVHILLLPARP